MKNEKKSSLGVRDSSLVIRYSLLFHPTINPLFHNSTSHIRRFPVSHLFPTHFSHCPLSLVARGSSFGIRCSSFVFRIRLLPLCSKFLSCKLYFPCHKIYQPRSAVDRFLIGHNPVWLPIIR